MSRKTHKSHKPNHQQSRRAFFETLERRDLLAVYPVAINDPIYNTALNTQLTSSTAVVANDFEAESHSYNAAVVANPANGTLNSFNTSTGQFTYTPSNNYTGIDTFTYKINNGTYDSNTATVSIAVGGVFGPRTNLDDQPLDAPLMTGANTVVQDLSLGERLIYRSDSVSLKPVIVVETSLKSGATVPNSIDAVLTFNSVGQGTVSYTNTGLAAGDTLRFALQADATSLATGYYAWSMTVTANYTGSTSSTTYSGYHAVVNRASSEYGKGWWLDGLDYLKTSGSGALLVRGNGDTLWFLDTGSGTYAKAAGDTEFSTLVKNGNNTYTLTSKHGMVENFGTTGLLTSRVDPNSNTFTYAYTDGDSDSVSDELYTITDPYNRVLQTLAYSGTRVSTFTDVASHVTTLAYTSGQLTSVTLADPDGAGSLAAPVWSYAYSGTTNLMTSTTDPRSKVESYTYEATSLRISRVDTPIYNQFTLLTPVQTFGLKTGTDNALVETVNPLGVFTDELGNVFKFQLDRFGNVLSFGYYLSGTSADVTDTSRDSNGLPYKILQPAISGTRYQTLLAYNTSGDLVKAIHHDATTQTWTYDSTFHNVLTAVDELSRTTTSTYNSTGNELTRADNAGNTWTTSYGSRTDGLPVSITSPDPDGAGSLSAYTTSFSYDSSGRLTTTTHPGSSTTVLAYDSADNVTSFTDELSHVTAYAWDALNRLTSITGADPDGGGSLTSPVTSFTYDAANNVLTEVDALSNTTSYVYDDRNRVTTKTLPDPDGGGSLAAPVLTFNNAGLLTSVTNPLSKVTSLGYDNLNRRTSLTLPDPDGGGGLSAPVYAYGYNAVGSLTTETDPLGNVTTTAYDNLQRRTTLTQADPDAGGSLTSPVWTWTYGSNALVATLTDPLGRDTDYGYDVYGRQTTVTNHEGYVTTTVYNPLDQVSSVTTPDPDGAGSETASVTTYSYDYLNRLASTIDALSGTTSFTYDLMDRLTNLRDPVNNDTSWAYDNAGRVTMETNELNNTRSFYHDAAGNLTRKKDRNERVTQYMFDDLDRMTAEKWLTSGDPVPTLGVSTTTQGGPVSEVQRVGYSIGGMSPGGTFTLSFGGNTTSGIAANASAATVQTALEGLASIGSGNISVAKTTDTTTAKQWTLTFQGTLAGADQSQVTINTASITYQFGPKTDVQVTDTPGQSSQNEVQVVTLSNATDGTFRLAFGGQTTAPIAYNASASTVDTALEALQSVDTITTTGNAGGPWTVTFTGSHANVNVATIQGDAAAAQSGSVARTISYTYDVASRLTDASDPDSTSAYTYDNIGRQLTVSNSGTSGVPTVVLTSVYDAASNRTQLSSTVGGTNDFKNDYTFDNLNRMTQAAQIGNGGNTVANKRANFAYNAMGQFTSVERQVKPSSTWNEVATTAFTYDTLNRVTGIDHKRSGTSLFTAYTNTYDRMDRITGITSQDGMVAYTYDKTSQLTGADYSYQTDETFAWDANGNPDGASDTVGTNNRLTSDGTYDYTYDDEGNTTRRTKISDSSYTDYTWDHRNRLTNVTNKTSGGTSTMSADYSYDVYDRRIKKVVDADGAGGGGSVTSRYVLDNSAGADILIQFDGSSNFTHRYVWGPVIDQLLADEDASHNMLWPLTDHQDSVRDVINDSGTVQNHIKFNVFGVITSESNAAVNFLVAYAGMERDEETGASYSWHRYFVNGTWLSEDRVGFLGGDENLHRYVHNSAVNLVDPTGFYPRDTIFGGIIRIIAGQRGDAGDVILNGTDQVASGLASSVTGGLTDHVREGVYGEIATQNHEGTLRVVGEVAGTGISIAVGGANPCTMGRNMGAAVRIFNAAEMAGSAVQAGDDVLDGNYGSAVMNVAGAAGGAGGLGRNCFVAGTQVVVRQKVPDIVEPAATESEGIWIDLNWLTMGVVGLVVTGLAAELHRRVANKRTESRNSAVDALLEQEEVDWLDEVANQRCPAPRCLMQFE